MTANAAQMQAYGKIAILPTRISVLLDLSLLTVNTERLNPSERVRHVLNPVAVVVRA